MTSAELKQLRRLLFIDVAEAAKYIGSCETRTWQRWEQGSRPIPNDVEQTMQMLCLTRHERLELEPEAGNPNYTYFETYEEYQAANGGGNPLMWRLAQSVAAASLAITNAEQWRDEETVC